MRHEVKLTVCPSVENPDLVFQKTGSQSSTHSRPAECGSRQAIQARLDHPDRMVSLSRVLPVDMQQVASTSDRPICYKVQQQTIQAKPDHPNRVVSPPRGIQINIARGNR